MLKIHFWGKKLNLLAKLLLSKAVDELQASFVFFSSYFLLRFETEAEAVAIANAANVGLAGMPLCQINVSALVLWGDDFLCQQVSFILSSAYCPS